MPAIAVFPGQGAQSVGMGRALADAFWVARAVFAEVDAALGESLSRLIFEGPAAELTLTRNAQPALLATSIAAVRALEALCGRPLAGCVAYVAGHSLGEYTALTAAGALSLADAARLLRLRGEAMQAAVGVGEGAMAAILGLAPETVEEVAKEAAQGQVCELANDNADGQAVVSGHRPAVMRAIELAKKRGARRALLLEVSAPFHCALMAPAAERLREALTAVELRPPAVPLIANVTAEPVQDPMTIRSLLIRQATARVRWREIMARMVELGIDRVLEFGPGKVLSGLCRRAIPTADTMSIATPADLDLAVSALCG